MSVDLVLISKTVINSALKLLPTKMSKPEQMDRIHVQMLAIGLQESRFVHRWQVLDWNNLSKKGPARGFWMFEEGGGVKGVMNHAASKDAARDLCRVLNVPFEQRAIWLALETNDVLAAGFARLLLWTDHRELPHLNQETTAWNYYYRNWRPGKPHPETWCTFYDQAVASVRG